MEPLKVQLRNEVIRLAQDNEVLSEIGSSLDLYNYNYDMHMTNTYMTTCILSVDIILYIYIHIITER